MRTARARMRLRRRRTLVLVLLLTAAVLVGVDLARGGGEAALVPPAGPEAPSAPSAAPATPSPVISASPAARRAGAVPVASAPPSGTFGHADGVGPVLGTAGTLRRFRVVVEAGLTPEPAAFAATVEAILGDARSWIASGRLRLQRVPLGTGAEFTVYLATPATSYRMCARGGLDTERYTSCRLPGQVIINSERWWGAVPRYGAPLVEYQAYAINHEVGHQLGYGHEACPGAGRVAPVMQQQTLGLAGCTAYGWPYRDGVRYAGASVS